MNKFSEDVLPQPLKEALYQIPSLKVRWAFLALIIKAYNLKN